MAKVTAEITMSLDGFVAGPNRTLEDPLGAGGEQLHEWAFRLKTFREMHGGEGGETDSDDQMMAEAVNAVGAIVMGRRMFSGGEGRCAIGRGRGWSGGRGGPGGGLPARAGVGGPPPAFPKAGLRAHAPRA